MVATRKINLFLFWDSGIGKKVGWGLLNICGWWLHRMESKSPRALFYPVTLFTGSKGFQFYTVCLLEAGCSHSAWIPFLLSLPFCMRRAHVLPKDRSFSKEWDVPSPSNTLQASHDFWQVGVLIWWFCGEGGTCAHQTLRFLPVPQSVTSAGALLNHQGLFGGQKREPISHRHAIENMALHLKVYLFNMTVGKVCMILD